jgi:hypothetical protein
MRIQARAVIAGITAGFMGCFAALAIAQGASQNGVSSPTMLQKPGVSFPSQLGTSVRNGTITYLNTTRMVIVHVHKGKTEQLVFVLNAETVRNSELAVGSQVTVHYRTENNQNIATSIQSRKQSPDVL